MANKTVNVAELGYPGLTWLVTSIRQPKLPYEVFANSPITYRVDLNELMLDQLINVTCHSNAREERRWCASYEHGPTIGFGKTPAHAAMRAFIINAKGYQVEVPEEVV